MLIFAFLCVFILCLFHHARHAHTNYEVNLSKVCLSLLMVMLMAFICIFYPFCMEHWSCYIVTISIFLTAICFSICPFVFSFVSVLTTSDRLA